MKNLKLINYIDVNIVTPSIWDNFAETGLRLNYFPKKIVNCKMFRVLTVLQCKKVHFDKSMKICIHEIKLRTSKFVISLKRRLIFSFGSLTIWWLNKKVLSNLPSVLRIIIEGSVTDIMTLMPCSCSFK